MYLMICCYAFYFVGTVNFISDYVVFFIWFQENQEQIYYSLLVLDKVFNAHFGANINSGFLFFLISLLTKA